MMKDLPSLDLSSYNDSERLPIKVDRIIVQALVFYKMNIDKVSEKFQLDKLKVSEIAVSYYTEITTAISSQTDISKVNKALTNSAELLSQHIKIIKDAKKESDSKVLKDSELKNICRIMDRLNGVQNNYSKLSEISTIKLSGTINNNKTTEATLEGKIEDDSDYVENQQTVFDKLQEFNYRQAKKPVIAIDKDTGEEKEFDSLKSCASYYGTSPEYVTEKIRRKTMYRDKTFFKFKNSEDNNE